MKIIEPKNCTAVLGEEQGYLPLPVRTELIDNVPQIVSAWEPSEEEIEKIVAGEPVMLTVLGTGQPPVILSVGDDGGA